MPSDTVCNTELDTRYHTDTAVFSDKIFILFG